MRKLLLIASLILITFSCENGNKEKKRILPTSSGRLNNLSVVVDNDLWENTVGEALRSTFAAPIDGLPQEEPLFSLNQIPPQVFTGFTRNNRSIIKIEKGVKSGVKISSDVYAKPQKLIVVSGEDIAAIKKQLKENSRKIIEAFKSEEIKENQRRIRKSLYKSDKIQENLGVKIEFSKAYRVAKEEDKFFWIRRDIRAGTMNLMIYELPLEAINRDGNIIDQIIKIRDSVGQKHIPGPIDGSYMITEEAYSPHLYETILDNKNTFETKGTWEVKGAFKAGPFINYSIEDKLNNRLIVAEGFVDAPSVSKREFVFELEAIIKSIKIN